MKKPLNPVLSNQVVDELRLKCCICSKAISGFYARFGNSGVCNKKHMLEVNETRRKEREEASLAYEKRHNLYEKS